MIGGNVTATIQVNTGEGYNRIGEKVDAWVNTQTITGWLDLSSGDSKYSTFNAKIQESTHVFVADYVTLDSSIKAESSRMIVDGARYDVMLIDDPMGLHKQLEIYLKFTGGQ